MEVVPMFGRLKVDHERHRREQEAGVERRHVRAIALSGFEDAHDAQRPYAFAQRPARDPEDDGEILLDRQSRSGHEVSARDHPLDALHDDVGLRKPGRQSARGDVVHSGHLAMIGRAPGIDRMKRVPIIGRLETDKSDLCRTNQQSRHQTDA